MAGVVDVGRLSGEASVWFDGLNGRVRVAARGRLMIPGIGDWMRVQTHRMKREPTSEEVRLIDVMNGESLPWCREAAFRVYYGSVRVDYMMANYARGKKEANAHGLLLLFDVVLHDVQAIPVKSVMGEARSRYGMAYFRSLVRNGVLTEPDKRLLVEHGVSERWLTIPGAPFRRRNRGPNGRVGRHLSEEDMKPLLDEGRSDTIRILIRQGVITKEEWGALRTYGALAIDSKDGAIQDMSRVGAWEPQQPDNERNPTAFERPRLTRNRRRRTHRANHPAPASP